MQNCHQLSESSKRETHFYELDIQVKGFSSLEESLVRATPKEYTLGQICIGLL